MINTQRVPIALAMVMSLINFASVASAQTFTTIDYPGSVLTEIRDIDGGNLVGWHQASPGPGQPRSGFKYDGTSFTDIHYPGSQSTLAHDIDGNNIVGWYMSPPGPGGGNHGFLYDGVSYTTLDYPGSVETQINGIDGNKFVGTYVDSTSFLNHGFLYDGTNWTTIDYPGSFQTHVEGVDGNKIVGWYVPGGGPGGGIHGFVFDGANYTPLDFPGSIATQVHGISGNNLVGAYHDGATLHGFVYDGANWQPINVPFSSQTSAHGVDGDTIVGAYQGGPGTHGFRTTKPVPPNEIVVRFTGEVTNVDDSSGWFNGSFEVGQSVSGEYTFFDRGFAQGISASFVAYDFYDGPNVTGVPPLPAGMTFESGGHQYTSAAGPGQPVLSIQVTNDSDGPVPLPGDAYSVGARLLFPPHFNNLACCAGTRMSVTLYDASGNALDTLDLPLTAPDLAAFASAVGRLTIFDINGGPDFAQVEFRIDSLTTVPEPTALLSVLLGVALIAVRRTLSKLDK